MDGGASIADDLGMKKSQPTYLLEGRPVRFVVQPDSDPSVNCWVCFIDNPDEDRMVPMTELEEVSQ